MKKSLISSNTNTNNFFNLNVEDLNTEIYNKRAASDYFSIKQRKYGKYQKYCITHDNKLLADNSVVNYSIFEKNRNTNVQQEISLNPRLLRVQTNLILPTQINISVITNSYDIIHS
jgi:hypothetical protein